jgi:nitric oxide reductase NorQ protein
VEARQDTIVVLHPLSDHRRELPIDRLNTVVPAAEDFMLVVSYNPGYQSLLKDLKDSTRQRMLAIELTWPPAEIEVAVVAHESGVGTQTAQELVALGGALRRLEGSALREVPSTRTLVAAARLMRSGIEPRLAARTAIVLPLTDDPRLIAGLDEILDTFIKH